MSISTRELRTADRGPHVVILTSVFCSLSFITTAIRLITRKLNRQLGWDDLAIFFAVVFTTIAWPFTILSVQSGYGRHADTLSKSQTINVLKWLWEIQFDLFFTLPLTKISICLFILRIKNHGWLRYFLFGMMIGLVLTNMPALIVLCAECQPLHAYWDRSSGVCWSPKYYNATIWLGVSFNIFSDLACTCLPVVVLWNVKMQLRMKYLVSILMSFGLIATACGAVRAYLSAVNNDSKDLTYDLSIITVWAVLEEHLAILGTNFALSRYIYRFYLGRKDETKSSIPLSSRRMRYTTITKFSQIEQDTNTTIPDAAVIKATTEIEVRSSFHSGDRPLVGDHNHFPAKSIEASEEEELY